MALNPTELAVLMRSDGPYLYWCPIGKHEWKMFITDDLVPPAMDGATLVCGPCAENNVVDEDMDDGAEED